MSTAGSREEMLEALKKARLAMARRAPGAVEPRDDCDDSGAVEPNAPRAPPAPSAARDNRGHFFDTWCRKIELFVADPTKTVLELPRDLPANDRRELHALADKYNLSHQSRGVGVTRQLILRKDALHYRMPDARPEDMDALRQTQQQRGGEKQSKFHLRRARADPDAAVGSIGAFGDGETARMVRRLDRATDEYRRAVAVGYTQDELLAIEAGETVEATLRRPCTGDAAPNGPQPAEGKEEEEEKEKEKGEEQKRKMMRMRMEQERPPQPKVAAVYDEVCLRCGATARVEYDVRKWECNGHCDVCARQTVWKLVEAEEDREGDGGGAAQQKQKQKQQEQEQRLSTSAAPEEIDKNNDEDDTVTVEDVVDMASMNDFCAADVNWVRRFAAHHQPPGSRRALNEHIVFCIDFADLPSMRIFRAEHVGTEAHSAAKRARLEEAEEWFLRLREVRGAGAPLSALLEEVAAGRYDAVAVAFPNMSVYGSGAVCICRVRVPQGGGDAEWAALQRKYGERHVQFSRVLDDVLSDETEIA